MMAIGRCNSMKSLPRAYGSIATELGDNGFEFVMYTRVSSFGRKRVSVFGNMYEEDCLLSTGRTTLKRHCSDGFMCLNELNPEPERSALECLPQDLLIRIVCGVDHDDLKQLFHVSKTIREATLVAKKAHFEYSTPKKSLPFISAIDVRNLGNLDEIEAPSAPKRRAYKSRLDWNNIADLSVKLFASPMKKKGLFIEPEM